MTSFELSNKLIDKSIEAFIMGLEIYNKPTIHYRVEGFSFFVCNAWELMLKSKIIKDGKSIYFKDNPNRTISLEKCLQEVYSDKNTRIRLNLEKIIDLRNTSTHFITEDYEVKYAPLFQACALNYSSELLRFHQRDISKYIPQNFLTIHTNFEPLSNEQIKLKYPKEIAEKFIQTANEIDVLSHEYNSDKFSINIAQKLYITKNKKEADFTISVENNSDNKVQIVKDMKDPSDTHKYSYNNVIKAVNERLKKKHIIMGYPNGFNSYVLNLVIDFYQIKSNSRFAYMHKIGNSVQYTYSQQFVEFIVDQIKNNPDGFVDSLKNAKKR